MTAALPDHFYVHRTTTFIYLNTMLTKRTRANKLGETKPSAEYLPSVGHPPEVLPSLSLRVGILFHSLRHLEIGAFDLLGRPFPPDT